MTGRNNRWQHERRQKKTKALRREQKAKLRGVRDEPIAQVRPPGYVSPYASERKKQERQGKKQKQKGGGSRVAYALDIDTLATEFLGGTYYCVGRDRATHSQLRSPRDAGVPAHRGDPVPPVLRVGTPGYL